MTTWYALSSLAPATPRSPLRIVSWPARREATSASSPAKPPSTCAPGHSTKDRLRGSGATPGASSERVGRYVPPSSHTAQPHVARSSAACTSENAEAHERPSATAVAAPGATRSAQAERPAYGRQSTGGGERPRPMTAAASPRSPAPSVSASAASLARSAAASAPPPGGPLGEDEQAVASARSAAGRSRAQR